MYIFETGWNKSKSKSIIFSLLWGEEVNLIARCCCIVTLTILCLLLLTKALKGIKGCGCFGKHAKSEIEFTWGKIWMKGKGECVKDTQTKTEIDILRSAKEKTLINYTQTMAAASAPEHISHTQQKNRLCWLRCWWLAWKYNHIDVELAIALVYILSSEKITLLVQYLVRCVCAILTKGTTHKRRHFPSLT